MLLGELGAATGRNGAKMKHISELTILKQSAPEPERPQDSTRPMRVWAQLVDMFGNAWYREHGENPGTTWQQAVWALTDNQIKAGLVNLGNSALQFPPNLSQFVSACKKPLPKAEWVKTTLIEDQRPRGKMPFSEWKRLNGVEDV